uniref:Uncharacterized protein n=1 Tax=Arundo donax TaxID=35708 RepID=A0A0A9ELJ6_ARUDO
MQKVSSSFHFKRHYIQQPRYNYRLQSSLSVLPLFLANAIYIPCAFFSGTMSILSC